MRQGRDRECRYPELDRIRRYAYPTHITTTITIIIIITATTFPVHPHREPTFRPRSCAVPQVAAAVAPS